MLASRVATVAGSFLVTVATLPWTERDLSILMSAQHLSAASLRSPPAVHNFACFLLFVLGARFQPNKDPPSQQPEYLSPSVKRVPELHGIVDFWLQGCRERCILSA